MSGASRRGDEIRSTKIKVQTADIINWSRFTEAALKDDEIAFLVLKGTFGRNHRKRSSILYEYFTTKVFPTLNPTWSYTGGALEIIVKDYISDITNKVGSTPGLHNIHPSSEPPMTPGHPCSLTYLSTGESWGTPWTGHQSIHRATHWQTTIHTFGQFKSEQLI